EYCLVEDPIGILYHALCCRGHPKCCLSVGTRSGRCGNALALRRWEYEEYLGHTPIVHYGKLWHQEPDSQLVYGRAQPSGGTSYLSQHQSYTLHKNCKNC